MDEKGKHVYSARLCLGLGKCHCSSGSTPKRCVSVWSIDLSHRICQDLGLVAPCSGYCLWHSPELGVPVH